MRALTTNSNLEISNFISISSRERSSQPAGRWVVRTHKQLASAMPVSLRPLRHRRRPLALNRASAPQQQQQQSQLAKQAMNIEYYHYDCPRWRTQAAS
jgi:hypothetical protein